MPSPTTYLLLRSDIEGHAKRGDIASEIDNFIYKGEFDIWEKLRVREMEARATASTLTTGRFLALPDGFIRMRRLNIDPGNGAQPIPMDYVVPEKLEIQVTANMPLRYTVGTQLEFERTSDQAYSVEMKYYKKLASLNSSNQTNAVLTNYPMIYLAAAMKHFGIWSLQDDIAAKWDGIFDEEVARANRQSRKGRYGSAMRQSLPGMVV